jgi:hypothetical protein
VPGPGRRGRRPSHRPAGNGRLTASAPQRRRRSSPRPRGSPSDDGRFLDLVLTTLMSRRGRTRSSM